MSLTKRVLALLLAAVVLPATLASAAYPTYPGQRIDIQKQTLDPAPVTIQLANLDTIDGPQLRVSLFGMQYEVDATSARVIDQNRADSSLQSLATGDKVDITGVLDRSNASLIRASLIRMALRTGSGGGGGALSVFCSGSPATIAPGGTVTWTANATGGAGNYTYSWTGNGSFPSGVTGRTVTHQYLGGDGTRNANVTVTSGGVTKTASCSIEVRSGGGTGGTAVSCSGPSTLAVNQEGTWNAVGGNGTYSWLSNGATPATGTGSAFTTRFSTSGPKTVTANSGDRRVNCAVQVTPGNGGGGGDGGGGDDGALSGITNAMYEHAKTGVNMNTPAVQKERWSLKKDDLSTWNGSHWGEGQRGGVGSQNIPLIAEAAAGNYKFFADLAKLERQEGLYGREFGSPGFYFSFPFAAKVVALRDARRANDTAAADEIAKEMEAVLTLWSLVSVQVPRTSEVSTQGKHVLNGGGNASTYFGLSVAVAGERWKSGTIGGNDTDVILSWALDAPRNIGTNGSNNLRNNNQKWWQNSIAWVAGVDRYTETTDPSVWGLTAESRSKLRSLARGEATHLNWAVSVLREYGVWKWSPVRLRRTSQGVETVFFDSHNGNKPAAAATSITNGGAWKNLKPCEGPGVGNNDGYEVTVANGTITATGDEPHCATVSMPELGGSIVYEVMINGKNVTLGNNQPAPHDDDGNDDDGGPGPGDGGGGGGGGGGLRDDDGDDIRDPFLD